MEGEENQGGKTAQSAPYKYPSWIARKTRYWEWKFDIICWLGERGIHASEKTRGEAYFYTLLCMLERFSLARE